VWLKGSLPHNDQTVRAIDLEMKMEPRREFEPMLPEDWRDDDEVARLDESFMKSWGSKIPFFLTDTNSFRSVEGSGIDMTVVIDTVELAAAALSTSGEDFR
jgi:hypothetical protein